MGVDGMISSFLEWVQQLPPAALLLLLAFAVLLGFVLSNASRWKAGSRVKMLEKDLAQGQKRIDSLKQSKMGMEATMESMKKQQREVASLITLLPDAVEKLSTSDETDFILDNLVSISERLLNARDVSVFLRQRDQLILKAASSSRPISSPPLTLAVGEGKIGWVAQKGISMTDVDLQHESNLVRKVLSEDTAGLKTRICSPMIYNGKLLGVLDIGELPDDQEQALRISRMITSLGSMALGNSMLKDQIRRGSEKDGLTGLYSLQYFLDELRKELSKARRYKRPLSLCHFDLDAFQKYNESSGYLAGDEVLRMISKILKDHLREHDTVARYSGKEFVLICPETKTEDAFLLAEKLRQIIEGFPFPHRERMPGGRLTVSGGVCGYPEGGTDEAQLIRSAVDATRESKQTGGNRISRPRNPKEAGKFSIQS